MNIRSCTLLLGMVALSISPARAGQGNAANQGIDVGELSAQVQLLAQLADANGDGKISLEELRSAGQQIRDLARDQVYQAIAARRPAPCTVNIAKVEQRIHQSLARADADRNGELTGPEIRHAVQLAGAEMHKRVHEHLKAHHANWLSLLAE